ncbi:hypothetical protein Ocin01_11616 [Orchesella cincta]|uniref:Uncharacterized protein n=1 Tax=Orchesella cincta TaxID=48709 RepID=A0A1D2MPN8_ORCCI|nr:hypothetical protein Ocin01_11616 [Orchesella cincta]
MEMDAGIAKGYAQLDEGYGTRRRNVEGCNNDDPAVYDELQRLRGLVEVIEGGDRTKGCLKLSLNNSAMSTIFGLVFMVIFTYY